MEEDIKNINEMLEASKIAGIYEDNKYFKAIENLISRNKELEEYKKYAELTKISCCTAQNCEALNNAIRKGIENQKLREKIQRATLQELLEES